MSNLGQNVECIESNGHEMNIDWDYYLSLPSWNVHQAACLLFRCDPEMLTDEDRWQRDSNPFIIRHVTKRLDAGIKLGTAQRKNLINDIDCLTAILKRDGIWQMLSPDNTHQQKHGPENTGDKTNYSKERQKIDPVKFVNWAIDKYDVPVELIDFAKALELQAKADAKKTKPDQKENSNLLRSEHVKTWVAQTNYTGDKTDKMLNTELHADRPELWGDSMATFQKWVQSAEGKEVLHLLPNSRRRL